MGIGRLADKREKPARFPMHHKGRSQGLAMDAEIVRKPNEEGSAKGRWTTKKIADELKKIFAAKGAQLDQNAKHVFDRLMSDDRVPEALGSIVKTDSDLNRVLLSCFQYEEIARTFNETMAKEREIIERTEKIKNSVNELASFLDQEISNPGRMIRDRLSAVITLSNEDKERLFTALITMADTISARQRVAHETILRYGATRKSAPQNKKAAQTAAIGWLADSIERIAGKPVTSHVAVLAEAILETTDIITVERVRKALKTRRGRDWRVG
jgi:hypothetical protein